MAYDNETAVPGRSKEVDAIAHAAAKEVVANPKGFMVNADDPANGPQCPQGNPEDPAYSRTRKIAGQ